MRPRAMWARCSTTTRRTSSATGRDAPLSRPRGAGRELIRLGPAPLPGRARPGLRHRAVRPAGAAACRRLGGVDLSPGMLEQARALGVYDQVFGPTRRRSCAHRIRHDLVLAADVLLYIGDLAPLFAPPRAPWRRAGSSASPPSRRAGSRLLPAAEPALRPFRAPPPGAGGPPRLRDAAGRRRAAARRPAQRRGRPLRLPAQGLRAAARARETVHERPMALRRDRAQSFFFMNRSRSDWVALRNRPWSEPTATNCMPIAM